MAYPPGKKLAVRSAYVHKSMSLEQASELEGVSFGTASRWKRDAAKEGDDWDKARAARFMSQEGADAVTRLVLEDFVTLFQSTIETIKKDENSTGLKKAEAISRLSDAYHKTMSAARKGAPEVNKLAVAMDVINMLSDFVGKYHPKHANAFLEILEPFGDHLSQNLL